MTTIRFTDDATLDNWFAYHQPTNGTAQAHEQIRQAARAFAQVVQDVVPECPDKTVAFRAVREAMYAANAAVACNWLRA